MKPLDIVFFDDDISQLNSFSKTLTAIFDEYNVETKTELYQLKQIPIDEQLAKIARYLVNRDKRPHIVIADNLIHQIGGAGQRLIATLKRRLPDTVFCLLTRESLSSDKFGLFFPNPDMVISKVYLRAGSGADAYRKYIGSTILGLLRRTPRFAFEWERNIQDVFKSIQDERGKKIKIAEVNSVIEQVLFDGSFSKPEEVLRIFEVRGGRSGSIVLGCRIEGRVQNPITGILKISTASKAKQELDNYHSYVKWTLPYTWRVDVIGEGFSESIGGVCYSFAFEGQDKVAPISASNLLQTGDSKIINDICCSILSPDKKTWYSELRASKKDISAYFSSSPYFSTSQQLDDRESKFISLFEKYFPDDFVARDSTLTFCGYEIRRPHQLILTEDWGCVEECICHGDMHGGNILVQPRNRAIVFIDFQNTGYHHIFKDFISLESSIRIDWPNTLNNSIKEVIEDEIKLALYTQDSYKEEYLNMCSVIRDSAFSNFPIDGRPSRLNTYLVAAYIQYCWLATRFEWTDDAVKRLLLGAFASIVGLERTKGMP
ncbi:aminoglycoside phosphotransferase family protein [Methylomonas sp. HW2-6]|uniref:aminoglycoside phosphotransferase family protein n=1 Tax=Methylomonas sp. HW2-6 TaxID=3376687 RepID=UPI004042F718